MIVITQNNIVINVDTITTMGINNNSKSCLVINTQNIAFETEEEMFNVFSQIQTYMINSSAGLLIDLRNENI